MRRPAGLLPGPRQLPVARMLSDPTDVSLKRSHKLPERDLKPTPLTDDADVEKDVVQAREATRHFGRGQRVARRQAQQSVCPAVRPPPLPMRIWARRPSFGVITKTTVSARRMRLREPRLPRFPRRDISPVEISFKPTTIQRPDELLGKRKILTRIGKDGKTFVFSAPRARLQPPESPWSWAWLSLREANSAYML